MQITTKRQFVKMYNDGVFGNRSPTWQTADEVKACGYNGLIHARSRIRNGPTFYNIPSNLLWEELYAIEQQGHNLSDFYFSGMCPHHRGTIQGEVQELADGLHLAYCSAKTPMNIAMRDQDNPPNHVRGVCAKMILEAYLCTRSMDWLKHLLETYPGHVIEFTSLDIEWGTVPGYNTLFWEVRLY